MSPVLTSCTDSTFESLDARVPLVSYTAATSGAQAIPFNTLHVPLNAAFYRVSIAGMIGEDAIGVFGAEYFP